MEKTIEKYAKGRMSISFKTIQSLGISEGDAFVCQIKDGKIVFSKVSNEELQKL